MRRLSILLSVLVVMCLTFGASSFADDVTQTLNFEWEQSDTTNLKEWRMYWSGAAGGPYDTQEVVVIPYDPNVTGPIYTGTTEPVVSGSQGTTVTKYFVLVACGDIPQAGGTTEYKCSDNSNEVSWDFFIPAGEFSMPINFKIVVTP